jgi:hypothetical protein
MAQILKQSTAVDVLIGPFVDQTNGFTSETGESPSVKLSKNGQALAAKNDVTTPVHDADGYYNCELDATDTNTVGTMILTVAASANALPVRHEFQVVEEAIYDALFGASAAGFDANGRVDVGSWIGTAVTLSATTTLPEVDAKSISDNAAAADNVQANIGNLDAPVSTVDTVVDGIQTDLSNATDGLGALKALIDTAQADLDTITGTDGVTLATAQALYAPAKAGDAMALTAVAVDTIWDETLTAHVTADSAAVALKDTLADTNELQSDDVPGLIATAQADLDTITGSDGVTLATAQSLYAPAKAGDAMTLTAAATSAQLVDDIWDEVNNSGAHNVTNSTGKQLREGTAAIAISSGTCAATGQTTSNIRLAASESSTNDIYNHKRIVIAAGTNAGFDAIISDYEGTNKDATISPAFPAPCDNTSEYEIVSAIVHTETQTPGYVDGAVWIDSVSGVAGTELYVNGTADNPVTNFTDADTIAAGLGLNTYRVIAGASVSLAASMDNKRVVGEGYTLALNGQSVSWTVVEGATITGNDDGSNTTPTIYRRCEMGANTLGSHVLDGCRLTGTITLQEGADYWWDNCYSAVAGSGTPSVDFQSAVETKTLSIRRYSGGIEFQNLGAGSGTHTVSLEGMGQFVTNANCVGGTMAVRGLFTKTLNGSGLSLTEGARLDKDAVGDAVADEALAGHTTAGSLGKAIADIETDATAILGDTNELQTDWADGGRLDVILDARMAEASISTTGGAVDTVTSVTNDVGISATAVDNIWDEDIVAAHNTADTAGAILNNILPEKNAAFSDIEFLWVAASDHVTPVTGASTTSVTRSIDGGAFGSATGTLAEVGNGIYQFDASAADMNGSIITFRFVATGGTPGAPDDAFVTVKTTG